MSSYAPYQPLLERRIPPGDVQVGRVYLIHARNGGVGAAVRVEGQLGYVLRREKMGRVYLWTEWDWSTGEPFGTAIPLRELPETPPDGEGALLVWLTEKQDEHRAETEAVWDEVLRPTARASRRWTEERARQRAADMPPSVPSRTTSPHNSDDARRLRERRGTDQNDR